MVRRKQALKPGIIAPRSTAIRTIGQDRPPPFSAPSYDPRLRRRAACALIVLNLLLWSGIAWGISLLF